MEVPPESLQQLRVAVARCQQELDSFTTEDTDLARSLVDELRRLFSGPALGLKRPKRPRSSEPVDPLWLSDSEPPPPPRLLDLPAELVVHVLKRLATADLGRIAGTCRYLRGGAAYGRRAMSPVEAAIRVRSHKSGVVAPTSLPEVDGAWEGQLFSCGTELSPDGSRVRGLLGHGGLVGSVPIAAVPVPVRGLAGVRVSAVAAGACHSLCLVEGGALFSWGSAAGGRHGHGGGTDVVEPRRVEALAHEVVVAMSAGNLHSLAVAQTGAVYSWGGGLFGALGHGSEAAEEAPRRTESLGVKRLLSIATRLVPTPVRALRWLRMAAVAAGDYHSLGAVHSWGAAGTVGNCVSGDQLEPQLVSNNAIIESNNIVQRIGDQLEPQLVAALRGACYYHSLALADGGEVYSWGSGSHGKLGHGDKLPQVEPRRVHALRGVRVRSVAAGVGHSLATADDGAAYGWGDGSDATLGLQLRRDQLLPLRYPHLRVALQ
ncbi:hypothetical protein EMIHUDRAFT_452497 [Emiliania huxleyi CCMP1516]|uniref:F-box domain-containing protein n=2 Tax=Emiliania huxleyi TaxID=2903 RepID=A0A0D3IIM9_EMIH1|nr:hypothetical protein EMIHUDRAFT_452497 [Emiliania huxleyi CCMP1516]EOD11114.1 hypothetical protein EMIHUDRAFT_452497 [Emiliania huxleyi CCMP1516]|eukprot:XP_005763543.1 hypothetical protein EMIHUDRAFT_452497 [Emiliania huxleyi CCMP1516]